MTATQIRCWTPVRVAVTAPSSAACEARYGELAALAWLSPAEAAEMSALGALLERRGLREDVPS